MGKREKDGPGGSFLIEETAPEGVSTPEDLTDDQSAVADGVVDFMKGSVEPATGQIESKDLETLTALVREAGDLGILGIDIPEDLGGLGADAVMATRVFEAIGYGGNGSYATTIGAHSGIGTWPILYFGTPEQQAAYLPKIASGEWIAAYALTEAGSGSDALSAKCKAVLEPDGKHYLVNGTKAFITNAHIAHVFTVFAKIDGADNACFIIEGDWPGVSIGEEEHKMGIVGSSTANLILEDVRVPVANLLGAPGKGHHVVLNTLNLGRFKLGAGCLGAIKRLVDETVAYTAEREQFGEPLSSFGAVQAMIADMVIAGWVGDSVVYRTAGMLEDKMTGVSPGKDAVKAIKSTSVECSIAKVLLSELLWQSADNAVQAYGGYGYCEEYPVARSLRDSRINRIFEGTNEVNRMIIIGDILKAAMKQEIPFLQSLQVLNAPDPDDYVLQQPGDRETDMVTAAKELTSVAIGKAAEKYMLDLPKQQQIMLPLADMVIDCYAMESALLRLRNIMIGDKKHMDPLENAEEMIVSAFLQDAYDRVLLRTKQVIANLSDGDSAYRTAELEKIAILTNRIGELFRFDGLGLRLLIAKAAIDKGGWPC